ncbi:hypothetical protein EPO33_04440 [Patescibacteria group bacterium]|nr:MAG: hypothetical protein EPO33_04440 [Patescibacteria group bacterium]
MRASPLIATLLGLTLLGAGCAAPAAPGASGGASGSGSVATRGGGACDNAYFPSAQGTKLEYATAVSGSSGSYSIEVQERSATNLKLLYTFSTTASGGGSLSFTQDVRCDDGALSALSYADIGSAVTGGRVSARTTRSSGLLMPRDISVGTTWTSSFDIEATITLPGTLGSRTVSSTINNESRVVGQESVTVPAGTYQAFKVESTLTTQSGPISGIAIPPQTVVSTSWFVEGLGMVKSVAGGMSTQLVRVTQ